VKSSYSILLVVAVAILLVGLVGLAISVNQQPENGGNHQSPFPPTSPSPQKPFSWATPYNDGYSDGYYGRTYDSSFAEAWGESGVDRYTTGYIEGSVDRKLEEQQ